MNLPIKHDMNPPATVARLGDWVRTTAHGHVGRVTEIHHWCPEDDDWIDAQAVPVTDEQLADRWVSVLVHGGGAIVAPIHTAVVLDEHPEQLDNTYAAVYFRTDQPAPTSPVLYQLTADDVAGWAGRPLTEDEQVRFAEAFPNTSVSYCIDGCLEGMGITPGGDEDEE